MPPSLVTPGLDLKRIDLWEGSPLPNPDFGGSGGRETNQNEDDNEDTAVCIRGRGGEFSRGGTGWVLCLPLQSDLQNSTPSFLLSGDKISINLFLIQSLEALAETGLGFQRLHLPHPPGSRPHTLEVRGWSLFFC